MDPASRIAAINAENPVVVWSKTYCSYCDRALLLLAGLEPRFPVELLQLDEMADGSALQAELLKMTGCMTVPQVFVGNRFIGGCTETTQFHAEGKLQPAIAAAVAAHAGAGAGAAAAAAPVAPGDEDYAVSTTTGAIA
jgi:glutaredoxin 3